MPISFELNKENELAGILDDIMNSHYLSQDAKMFMDEELLVQKKWETWLTYLFLSNLINQFKLKAKHLMGFWGFGVLGFWPVFSKIVVKIINNEHNYFSFYF